MRYRTDPPDARLVVPLDTLTAIYHRRSGQTHLVTEPVPEILSVLAVGETDIAGVLERMGIDDDTAARAVLAARLDEMVTTGLVAAS